MSHRFAVFIDFLDQHWDAKMTAHVTDHPLGDTPEDSLRKLNELRQAFQAQLRQMSQNELALAAYAAMDELDEMRPFNQLGTDADYQHFGKCAYLSAEEAVTLSLGKDPRFVNAAMVLPYLGQSNFAFKYAERFDLVDRAVTWLELPKFFTPLEFLTWAHKYKVPVPDAFTQCTFAQGEPIQYWHELCQVLQDRLVAANGLHEATSASNLALQTANEQLVQRTFDDWLDAQDQIDRLKVDHEALVKSLRDELAWAHEQQSSLTTQLQRQQSEAPLSTTERRSVLTIALTAACDGYGYNPADSKSPVPKEIADAAHLLGLKITDDTVRKYLTEAVSLRASQRKRCGGANRIRLKQNRNRFSCLAYGHNSLRTPYVSIIPQ
jgi:hypothetical protein